MLGNWATGKAGSGKRDGNGNGNGTGTGTTETLIFSIPVRWMMWKSATALITFNYGECNACRHCKIYLCALGHVHRKWRAYIEVHDLCQKRRKWPSQCRPRPFYCGTQTWPFCLHPSGANSMAMNTGNGGPTRQDSYFLSPFMPKTAQMTLPVPTKTFLPWSPDTAILFAPPTHLPLPHPFC